MIQPQRRTVLILLGVALVSVVLWRQLSSPVSPDSWTRAELDRYLALELGYDRQSNQGVEPQHATEAGKAIIAGTSNPLAVHAGLKVLKAGGSAADAALTTSFTQIALNAGAAMSYAGIMTAVYYDAATRGVYTLNAAYNTVQDETDPLSIPREASGRTTLVPGFMAGAQALHGRFGKLPFATLFGTAIWIADHGVTFTPVLQGWLRSSENVMTRLPETRRIFTRANQSLYESGDLFRQPELAATLRRVAGEGSQYMYTGEWARHFVDAVQRDGGRMTMEDLAAYRAGWTEPLRTSYGDDEAVSLGPPNLGGAITLGSLKAAEADDLKKDGPYTRSADALYDMVQILRIETWYAFMSREARSRFAPGVDPAPEAQVSRDTSERLLALIRSGVMLHPPAANPGTGHSAAVIAVDEKGNVACILHSSNTNLWGKTGIVVDGVSIPDSASFQQQAIAATGPGKRLPETTNPLIVLRNGEPVLASVAIGNGLQQVTFQNLINVLDFGMDPGTAVAQPNTHGPYIESGTMGGMLNEFGDEAVDGEFSQTFLDQVRARGLGLRINNRQAGYWIGVQLDRVSHKLRGGATRRLPSEVEGY